MTREIAPVAHGPAGTLEKPDWPPLTLDEADAVLRLYPEAGGAARLVTVSPRPFSAASVVETPRGALRKAVFVKRHHQAVRSRAGLLEEHRLLEYLAAARWPGGLAMAQASIVQAPLRDASGGTVQVRGEWVYEAHPVADGADLYREAHSWTPFASVEHARAAGRALAGLHLALKDYDVPARMPEPLVTSWTIFAGDDPLRGMEAYLERRPALKAYAEERRWRESMRELLLPWHESLRGFLPHLKPLWTHNDFHASNLMWKQVGSGSGESESEARVSAIVDFGLADRTNAVHDVATAIERNAIEWLRMTELATGSPGGSPSIVHYDQVDALLAGYQEIRPLSRMERQAIAAMLPLVHCEFALSETDYFLSVLHDPAKAYLGYEGYFLSHAAWFRAGEGVELLRHLERWADSPEHEVRLL